MGKSPFKEHFLDWSPQQWMLYYAALKKIKELKQQAREQVVTRQDVLEFDNGNRGIVNNFNSYG